MLKPKPLLRSLFNALTLLPIVPAVLAQPTISIAPVGQQSVLFWPMTGTNYTLQSTTNLSTPNWVTANDAIQVIATTVSNTVPSRFFRLSYTNPPAGMALIPAGSFIMGNSTGDSTVFAANPINIYVSAFYMDINLVTYTNWQTIYNAAITSHGYTFVHAGSGVGPKYPVQPLDWYDCLKWCNARSELAGLTPVYYSDAALTQVYKTGEIVPYINTIANGYRLPTEAEWEKAARGGATGLRFPWGNRIDGNQANYAGFSYLFSYDLGPDGTNPIGNAGDSSTHTTPVGSFDVNGYGLYDMAGNVFEWCWDWFGTYGQPTTINPTGPATGGVRILRGGTGLYSAEYARCAYRYFDNPDSTNNVYGFRCVRGL